MRKKRWLQLGCFALIAGFQSAGPVRSQGVSAVSLVVRSDGTAWLWMGSGTELRQIPEVTDAEAGGVLGGQAALVRANGTVWTWSRETSPELARTGLPRGRSLACSVDQCFMVTRWDRVVAWRDVDAASPVQGLGDVAAVALGGRRALALTHTGRVWTWSPDAIDSPTLVPGLHGIESIAASDRHYLATSNDGTLWAWGANDAGQLGMADLLDRAAPVAVPGIGSAVQGAASDDRSYVLTADGELWAFGAGHAEPRRVASPGEFVRLHTTVAGVLAERVDGGFWDCQTEQPLAAPVTAILAPAIAAVRPTEAPGVTGTAALIVGPGSLSSGDAFILQRLQALGLKTAVVRQEEDAGQLTEASVIVLSASVDARAVDAAALAQLAVPIVTWERFLFAPMGLTAGGRLPSHHSTTDRRLSIIRPGHPLAAGLDGHLAVLERAGPLTGAEPAPAAEVVAVSATGWPAVFAYEAGSVTASDAAPARRVGLFLPAGAEHSLNSDGAALFDAAVRWAVTAPAETSADSADEAALVSGTILLVVGPNGGTCASPTLFAVDALYKSRMQALGFTVLAKGAACAVAADATGKAMVLVSHTAPNGDVMAKFLNVTVPVAVQTSGIVDDMKMADLRGLCTGQQTTTTVTTPGHPIANGLTGLQTVSTTAGFQEWGTPSANGDRVLGCDGQAAHATTFTYVSGAGMMGTPPFPAPARRTFWGFYDPIPTTFTQTGRDLFDRMILWTTNTTNQPPVVNAGPNQAATTCEDPPRCVRITLPGHVFDDGLPSSTTTQVWSVVSATGPVTIYSPTSAVTEVTFDNTGTHVLRLTASDGALSASDDVVVQVYGADSNQPPVADAGPDQVTVFPSPATLTGSATDEGLPNPPGTLTYQWSRVSGPGTVTFGTPNAPTTTATLQVQGKYILRLTASDSILSAYDDVEVVSNKAALLVVGNPTPLTAGDAALKARMEALGFPVIVRDDALAVDADAANKAMVWLSSTVDSEAVVGSPFATVSVPVVVQTSGFVDNLQMTTGETGTSGSSGGQTQVSISVPAHPLSAGLLGTVTISSAATYAWVIPSGQAVATGVARLVADPPRYPMFAYEQGAPLASGLAAPERRLFFGFQDAALAGLSASGRRLLDAAILWSGRTNAAPWVDAGPALSATLTIGGATVNLAGRVVDDGLPNGVITASWTKVGGPGTVSFGNPSQAATTATFTLAGTYVLRLSASDGAKGGSDLTTVTILLAGANRPPSVSAGGDQTIRFPQWTILSATAADDGLPGPLTVSWTKASGPPGTVVFMPPNALSTTVAFPGPGVYVLKVTVSDGALTASDEVQVTVEASRPALFVVGTYTPLNPDDARAKQEMESLGFAVTLRNDLEVGPADADTRDVVVISASVDSTRIQGMFQATTKPVVLWEWALYDNMGMTAADGGTAIGTTLSITQPSHPLAAGLSGTPTVYGNPSALLAWGSPSPNAFKVATLPGDASKATVFAYELGSSMAVGAAPARRVGVFGVSASSFSSAGAALFRASIKWATEKPATALLVVASSPLSASDRAIKERIASLGYGVTVVTGSAATGAEAVGQALVVISNAPAAVGKYKDALTAVVVWDGSVMAAMGMVPATPGVGYGTLGGQTQVSIVQQLHPLSAGLTGLQTTTTTDTYTWGQPAAAAVRVATLAGDASRATVFGYEVDAALQAPFAPAKDRRAGLFLGANTGTLLTAKGGQLLDAALRWAASSDPDRDGLGTADEYRWGTDPRDADSNDDGVLDGAAVSAGISPISADVDGDGLSNVMERILGTDPFNRDTDGDGVVDGIDCIPLDPTRVCPAPVPGDVTPPVIQLIEPVTAVLISSVP